MTGTQTLDKPGAVDVTKRIADDIGRGLSRNVEEDGTSAPSVVFRYVEPVLAGSSLASRTKKVKTVMVRPAYEEVLLLVIVFRPRVGMLKEWLGEMAKGGVWTSTKLW